MIGLVLVLLGAFYAATDGVLAAIAGARLPGGAARQRPRPARQRHGHRATRGLVGVRRAVGGDERVDGDGGLHGGARGRAGRGRPRPAVVRPAAGRCIGASRSSPSSWWRVSRPPRSRWCPPPATPAAASTRRTRRGRPRSSRRPRRPRPPPRLRARVPARPPPSSSAACSARTARSTAGSPSRRSTTSRTGRSPTCAASACTSRRATASAWPSARCRPRGTRSCSAPTCSRRGACASAACRAAPASRPTVATARRRSSSRATATPRRAPSRRRR